MNIKDIFDKIDGISKELTEETIVKFQKEWNLPLSDYELNDLR